MNIELTDEQQEIYLDNADYSAETVDTTKLYADLMDYPGFCAALNAIFKSLDIDQIKQLAESKGLSVIEWKKLDEKSYKIPPLHTDVISQKGDKIKRILETPDTNNNYKKWRLAYSLTGAYINYRVTHWCELPMPPNDKKD